MIILHAAAIVWGEIGGPNVSVPNLVAAQNRMEGVEAALAITVANRCDSNATSPPQTEFPLFDFNVVLAGPDRLKLPPPFDRPDVVVLHSTYIPAHAAIAARLRKAGIPYIICPRGGMMRSAQVYRGWKKKLGNRLFFNRVVSKAAALQFLTQGEAEQSVDWQRPMFVVGNGVALPSESDLSSAGTASPLRLVFIGRLAVEIKGLDLLVEGCAAVRPELIRRDARIELHGPDFRGGERTLRGMIVERQLEEIVTVDGAVGGPQKQALLQRTDVFIHTSRWEGHPNAVLEALAYGVPCLLTRATNMADEVAAAGAGWSVESTPKAIAEGIGEILACDRNKLAEMGGRARDLVVNRYGWDRVASRSVEAYRDCVG
ncbi:MAG: glycosyltransferase [Candidatus Nealsonbacteria bacterium]|nr:glycosyltransferase [Candidatus Nealsonbacteria bacterium]